MIALSQMSYITAPTLELLIQSHRELVAQVQALRDELREHGIGVASDAQGELVEAAYAAVGSRSFVASELLTAALDTPLLPRLAAMLADKSPKSVGKALRAAADKTTSSGLVLRAVGDCAAGKVWSIESEFQNLKPTERLRAQGGLRR